MTFTAAIAIFLTAASVASAGDPRGKTRATVDSEAVETDWSPRVTEVSGDVLIYASGGTEGLPAEAGTPLEDGDRIETASGGRAELAMEPDSVVELGSKTSFTMGSTKKNDSWFSVDLGSFLAKLKSMAENHRRFAVRTPTAVCAVRGTEFGVEVGEDGETAVGVFDEGQVAVSGAEDQGGEETVLTSQNEVVLKPGERPEKPRALKRFKSGRKRMSHIRERRAELSRGWKALPPEKRRALRQQWTQGMRERLKNMPAGKRERLMKGFQEHRDKMQKQREGVRERLQNMPPEKKERKNSLGEQRRDNPSLPGGNEKRRKGPPPRGRRR